MSRVDRLFLLLQALRRRRSVIGGPALADELGVSRRTLYRDIGTLRDMGARIDGEAGVGYRLQPGFVLPPLMFSSDELEALILGARWVARRDDAALAGAALEAISRIRAVLPERQREALDATTLFVGPAGGHPAPDGGSEGLPDAATVERTGAFNACFREAMRAERRTWLRYADERGALSERWIWPFAIADFEALPIAAAWCELRQDFRHFRFDRVLECRPGEDRYPRRRLVLMAEWRQREGIAGDRN